MEGWVPMGGCEVIGNEDSGTMGGNQKYVVISLHNCNQDTDSYTLNKLHYMSTSDISDPINDNTNEKNEKNKEINSDNHNQIIQNTIINKKRKRNIISEEKKQNMGRKKKGFYDDSTKDSNGDSTKGLHGDSTKNLCDDSTKDSNVDSTHTKYSEDNVIKKIVVGGFRNFCYDHLNDYLEICLPHREASDKKYTMKKNKQERRFNRDFYLKLLPSSIEDYLSKEISPKYTKNREPNEEPIKILKIICPELKDFFEQTFIDGLKKYTNGYYDSMYENPADNKYLYCQLKIDEFNSK